MSHDEQHPEADGGSDVASELAGIQALSHALCPDPAAWSLAVDASWLERSFFGSGATGTLVALPTGELGGCASVRMSGGTVEPPTATVISLLRSGCEDLWAAQLAWIEARVEDAGATSVRVVSECLSEAEIHRWNAAGCDLVFEELAMERNLAGRDGSPAPEWPCGTTVLEWSDSAAEAKLRCLRGRLQGASRVSGWSRAEWIERITGDPDFWAGASLCVLREGVPAGFVVCSRGWVDQIGVAPGARRLGLARALLAEATGRMRSTGTEVACLHVNTNNPGAMAAWHRLGWRDCGRRGRFERAVSPPPDIG